MQKTTPFTCHSARLELVPLTPECLRLWIDDLPALEAKLNAKYCGEYLDILRDIIAEQLNLMPYFDETQDREYAWYTFWMIIQKDTREIIGSFDVKSGIDKDGRLEIGYGLGTAYEHHGYMTETVKEFLTWAFRDPRVSGVIAETERDNIRSQNVLKRCGFSLTSENETLWWLCPKPTEA